MVTRMQYEVWENQKYTIFCLYDFEKADYGLIGMGMCQFKNGANTLKDAKEQMKAHYADMHGDNDERCSHESVSITGSYAECDDCGKSITASKL